MNIDLYISILLNNNNKELKKEYIFNFSSLNDIDNKTILEEKIIHLYLMNILINYYY